MDQQHEQKQQYKIKLKKRMCVDEQIMSNNNIDVMICIYNV